MKVQLTFDSIFDEGIMKRGYFTYASIDLGLTSLVESMCMLQLWNDI